MSRNRIKYVMMGAFSALYLANCATVSPEGDQLPKVQNYLEEKINEPSESTINKPVHGAPTSGSDIFDNSCFEGSYFNDDNCPVSPTENLRSQPGYSSIQASETLLELDAKMDEIANDSSAYVTSANNQLAKIGDLLCAINYDRNDSKCLTSASEKLKLGSIQYLISVDKCQTIYSGPDLDNCFERQRLNYQHSISSLEKSLESCKSTNQKEYDSCIENSGFKKK
jgi:hypothetical protein